MLHLLLFPVVLLVVLFAVVVRVLTAPFRMGGWNRRHYGYGRGWGGYGRRHPYGGGGLMTILALVALERLFGRRYY